ncbi:MAG: hypothetical protein Q9174_005142 [Haloplaca sp. 1 TL-2023]
MAGSEGKVIELSVLDQLPFMRTYTQMLLCFPLASDTDRNAVVKVLQQATSSLVEAFPILTGQVQNHKDENSQVKSTGTFRVVPYNHPSGSLFMSKVLDDWHAYRDLSNSQAPTSMLDDSVTAPMKGFPDRCTDADVTPTFLIQANFIRGGLILCFSGMHSAMDATGLGQLIQIFAMLCRNEKPSAKRLEEANPDRSQLPVFLKPGQSAMSHPEVAAKPHAESTDDSKPSPPALWSYFNIPAARLKNLKAEGSQNPTPDVPWVTTNDVVTAFLWRAILRARSARIGTEKDTLLLRAVSGRRALDPPMPAYVGNFVTCSAIKFAVKTLVDEASLSQIAQAIRKSTNSIDDHHVRSFATLIQGEPDKDKITFAMEDADRDFLVSSWQAVPAYEDFGTFLGRPEFVRRPTGAPWPGVCYILPMKPDGSLDLLVSLGEDVMKRLMNDEQFAREAQYIG